MLDEAYSAFITVRVCKLFHDFGRLEMLETGYPVDRDFEYQMLYEALENVTDNVWVRYNDYEYEQKLYYSDPAMMEYYRLCRDYCNRFGVSLKDNPYMKSASDYVGRMLNFHKSSFMYILQTKINHEHASGIVVFYLEEYFSDYFELAEALLYIFDFYKTEAQKLRAELALNSDNAESKTKEAA